MRRVALIAVILITLFAIPGCSYFEKEPLKIWWGQKGDTTAWDKAKEVMENYNWIVVSTDQY